MKTWQNLKQNPTLFQRYFIKEFLIKACREFFELKNYHELESPIITNALPQERYLDVLTSQIELKDGSNKIAYLTPTTETYNKKILAAGLGEHFVITKVLRGLEQISNNHSPEFTMLEWYHLNATYKDLMTDCEALFKFAFEFIKQKLQKELELKKFPIDLTPFKDNLKINYQGESIDLSGSWHRFSIPDALKTYANLSLEEIQSEEEFRQRLIQKGYKVENNDDWQRMFEWVWENEIEQHIPKDKPVFVFDFPKQICVLTKPNQENPFVCERIEIYLAGKEIGNGYTELLDYEYQNQKFIEEQQARIKLGLREVAFDHDLINALKSGLPNVAGIGIGLDRVAMVFANAKNIADINYFPVSEWE
jgi:elongation factor P--beta-lysine ligase